MAVSEGCLVGEKMTLLERFCFGTVLAFEEVLRRVYKIPRVITYRFNSKIVSFTLRPPYWCEGHQHGVSIQKAL